MVLHPHLIDLGFPAFLRAAPPGHLFLKPAKDGDVLGPLQGLKNRLSEFVRTVITNPNVAPMHGFRHRFKTIGLEAGISTRVLDATQGHTARTAGDSYGDVTVKAMAMAMAKVGHDLHGVRAVGLKDANRPGGSDPVAVKEDHDLPDDLLLGPGGRSALRTHVARLIRFRMRPHRR